MHVIGTISSRRVIHIWCSYLWQQDGGCGTESEINFSVCVCVFMVTKECVSWCSSDSLLGFSGVSEQLRKTLKQQIRTRVNEC